MVFKSARVALLSALFVGQAMAAGTSELPAPVKALTERGLEVVGTFAAPGGLTGYAGTVQGQPIAVYLTSDGKHVVVGNLLDEQGKDLTSAPLDKLVNGPRNEAAWKKLPESSWVPDGKEDAPRIVYVFDDPECPYCHKFWKEARPWVDAGKVQIRHVMVGIITRNSPDEAAVILASKDPAALLAKHEQNYRGEGKNQLDASKVPQSAHDKVQANGELMQELGLSATPAIFYQNPDGSIGQLSGAPQGPLLEEVMGSPMPKGK